MEPFILHADHVVTMDDDLAVIADGAVLISPEGRIGAVGKAPQVTAANPGVPVRRLRDRVLMPGLINAHCHSGLLRGTAEGLPVWEWLQQYIDPMHRVLTPHEAEIASWLCYAEALLSGTTTIVDMWRFMDGAARAADRLGIRAVLVPYVAEHPDHNYFETLDSNERLIREWHDKANGRIHVWVGLEHMFYATPDGWRRAVELAHRYGVGLHMHSNESRSDVDETLRIYGLRPVHALAKHGLLDAPRVLLAHGVWLDDSEIDVLAAREVGIVHNPISNMKLASGAAPVEKLLAAGIAVGLGTDGEKENNNLDLFEELKAASLLAKLSAGNAAALDSWDVLHMATRLGADALGLGDEIGSIEVGKRADLIAVRSDTPRLTPLITGAYMNLHHNLVHAVQGGDVSLTIVDGQVVTEDGRLANADLRTLIQLVNEATPQLLERRDQWVRESGGAVRRAAG